MKKDKSEKLSKHTSIKNGSIDILMSAEVDEILSAIYEAKKEIKGVKKSSKNPYFKSEYADLNEHLETVEPALENNGILLLQPINASDSSNFVMTMLVHVESGQYIAASVMVPKNSDPQKVGASITYFRRFGINSLLSLRSIDDDGETASGRGKKFKKKKRKSEDDEF